LGIYKRILGSDECDNDRQGTLVLEKGFGRVSGVVGSGACGISAGFGDCAALWEFGIVV
jgi:hypothetical protein